MPCAQLGKEVPACAGWVGPCLGAGVPVGCAGGAALWEGQRVGRRESLQGNLPRSLLACLLTEVTSMTRGDVETDGLCY